MYLLGYDIGSSSIKAALVNAGTGETVSVVQHPEQEMEIIAQQPGLGRTASRRLVDQRLSGYSSAFTEV